ncbi:MAG: IS66 family insertion sequence element accessory protein TnpB [Polyangiaceae bacterium]
MIGSTRQVSVYAYGRPVDMRKSFDTLAALVKSELRREVLSGDVFVFVGKTRRRAKVLYWDGTGLCLFAKRLEKGHFAAPWQVQHEGPLRWTMSELSLFLEGSELVGRVPLSPEPWLPAQRAVAA